MCGILMITGKKYHSRSLLQKGLSRIGHRGYDNESLFEKESLLIGFRRLAIRKGGQPTFDPEGMIGVWLVGEIYNSHELGKILNINTLSEGELLIGLYKKFKDSGWHLLEGMYHIVLYDQGRQEVRIITDPFNIKPLSCCSTEDGLVFASEERAIRAVTGKHPVNEETLQSYLLFQYPVRDEGFRKDIRQVPSGSLWIISLETGKNAVHPIKRGPSEMGGNKTISAMQLLGNNIVRSCISDRPLAFHLSGGVDSSLNAILYSRAFPERDVIGFNCFFSDEDLDKKTAEEAGSRYNIRVLPVRVPTKRYYEDLVSITEVLDRPLMSGGVHTIYHLARAGAEQGFKVLISGQGADELFMGYERFLRFKPADSLLNKFRLAANYTLPDLGDAFDDRYLRDLEKKILKLYLENIPDGLWTLNNFKKAYQKTFLRELLLTEDRLHMHFNIENRVPYLNKTIAEKARTRRRPGKRLLKDTLRELKGEFITTLSKRQMSLTQDKVYSFIREPLISLIEDNKFSFPGFDNLRYANWLKTNATIQPKNTTPWKILCLTLYLNQP